VVTVLDIIHHVLAVPEDLAYLVQLLVLLLQEVVVVVVLGGHRPASWVAAVLADRALAEME
jgi:hypothetical protein